MDRIVVTSSWPDDKQSAAMLVAVVQGMNVIAKSNPGRAALDEIVEATLGGLRRGHRRRSRNAASRVSWACADSVSTGTDPSASMVARIGAR